MGIYRIIDSNDRTQIDLEKLDPSSGEWRLMCTVVREAGPVSVNG